MRLFSKNCSPPAPCTRPGGATLNVLEAQAQCDGPERQVSVRVALLVVSWLLGSLRAAGPYPLLAISGEQGSAKIVLSKLLRDLVDPSVAPLRAPPRQDRELFIAANNGHVLAFDNLAEGASRTTQVQQF